MLASIAVASTHCGHQHQRALHLAAGEEPLLCGKAVNGVHADAEEINEHELDYGSAPGRCHPDSGPNERCFRYRGIAHPFGAKGLQEALGSAPYTTDRCEILPHDENGGIGSHFELQRFIQRTRDRQPALSLGFAGSTARLTDLSRRHGYTLPAVGETLIAGRTQLRHRL